MRVGGKSADDLHVRLDLGIGLVHDPKRRLGACDQRERRAHVLGHGEFRFGRGPRAELLQRGLGVFADRHGAHVGGDDAAVADELRQVEAGRDGDVADLGVLGCDQHQPVAEKIDAGVVHDELVLRTVVHPVEVGGGEHVGGRAVLDLLDQRGTCRIARHHLDARALGEGGIDVVERVLQRGGGKDRDGFVLRQRRGRWARQRHAEHGDGEKCGDAIGHSGAPAAARSARMPDRITAFLTVTVLGMALASPPTPALAQDKTITVFAAASLKNALDDVDAAFAKSTGIKVVASYAASSALIKQIENGAPADVFASADLDWMDYGAQRKLIKDDTRVNLLGNRLVLITPKDSKIGNVTIVPGFDLAKLVGDGRVVTADVRAVPVGKYAKAALEKLGAWAAAEPKFAMTENVRAALTLVARGEAPLGIVYQTDAKVEPNVKIVGAFPADSHPPIVYPVALTVNAKPEAARYLAFLRSPAAKAMFETYGFTFLVRPTS